jgi:hypothetical protein
MAGIGYSVEVDSEGQILTTGPPNDVGAWTSANATKTARRIVDGGESVDLSAVGYFAYGSATGTSGRFVRCAVDSFDRHWVPVPTAAGSLAAYVVDSTLTLVAAETFDDAEGARAVAVNPIQPDYEEDFPSTNHLAETVFVGTTAGTTDSYAVHKLEHVEVTAKVGTPRTMVNLAVAGGNVKTFVAGATAPSTPTGGAGALDASSQYVQAAVLYAKAYLTDGVGPIKVYDPREDAITDLVSMSAGQAPTNVRILEAWRGRLVACRAAGLVQEAFAWAMSAIDDPTDWDILPPVEVSTQAVAGSTAAGPGLVPDIVNGFVPWSDDHAYFLCDHSIYQLTGDPMDGGEFDLVTEVTGGAFGRAWAKDPEGNLYFFGSRGGLFMMRPGQMPARVSLNRVERRLQEVDLATHYIRMAWNYRDEGLHIFQCPFGSGGTAVRHWFFDAKVGAIWEDAFGTAADTSVQPTAVLVIDGDQVSDRFMVIGTEDGFLRQWDEEAADDDGVAIYSHVLLGPLAGPSPTREARFKGVSVSLAPDLAGGRYELYASHEPDVLQRPVASGTLGSGLNARLPTRARGSFCYLRVSNAAKGQRWALENASVDAYPAGRQRSRAT